ncbi:MAG: WHG domain-containing protein [Eubacteriales bacterium]|nr:WHG domain-containing protein [Eubacteriales bacterium]
MARAGLDRAIVIEKAAHMANEVGLEKVSLKSIADEFGIQTPSLYNHIKNIDDLKKQIMLFGWRELENRILMSIVGVSGYDALRVMCYTFYDYATENPGVFNAMLWYNKYQDEEAQDATKQLFEVLFKIMGKMQLSEKNINHIIRTFRGFLEGYALLVNNGAFGNPASERESLVLSVEIILNGIKTLEKV